MIKLKVGDKVTSDFHSGEISVVRTITFFEKDSRCGSGYRASADGGGYCAHCNRPLGKAIFGVDAAWFKKFIK